jgi:uncharacterized protein YegL
MLTFPKSIFESVAVLACILGLAGAAAAKEKIVFQSLVPKLDPLPPPKVLHGAVAESNMMTAPATNAFGYAEQKSGYPTTVSYVSPNSVAWHGGLQAGDKITNGRVDADRAYLIIDRGGKKYGCVLRLGALSGKPDSGTGGDGKKLASGAAKSDTQTLTNYSIAMVVDNSASMGTKDCPGDISRWQWCKDHIGELYAEGGGVLQKNISIVTFDSNFHSRQNCSPSELQSVFAAGDPTGESNMGPALQEAFLLVRRQLDMRKPAIVSVISDGRPSDVERVKQAIIRETNILPDPKLLSIIFIEVGSPDHYLQELDNDLVKQGASADIVKVIPFASASSQGLSKTLALTLPKPVESSAKLNGTAAASGPNRASQAVAGHVATYSFDNRSPSPAATPPAPVKPRPPVVPAPPVKAHPTGISADGVAQAQSIKPVEVDEKAAALRGSANRTYK